MTKYMTINGEQFEVINSKHSERMFDWWSGEVPYSLERCYERPSEEKRQIWEYWDNWACDSWPSVSHFGISSYNTFSFVLKGLYWDENDNPIGLLVITKAHNKLYLL